MMVLLITHAEVEPVDEVEKGFLPLPAKHTRLKLLHMKLFSSPDAVILNYYY